MTTGGSWGTGGGASLEGRVLDGELLVRRRVLPPWSVAVMSEDVEGRASVAACSAAFFLVLDVVRERRTLKAEDDLLGGDSSLGAGGSALLINVTAR